MAKRNWSDFDSAIPRFESSLPSQPLLSLPNNFPHSAKRRHFRRLAATGPVSGKEFWAARAKRPQIPRRVSAQGFFIRNLGAGASRDWYVSAETGSNPGPLTLRAIAAGHHWV